MSLLSSTLATVVVYLDSSFNGFKEVRVALFDFPLGSKSLTFIFVYFYLFLLLNSSLASFS